MADPEELLVCPPTTCRPAVPAVRRTCCRCLAEVWVSWVMAPVVDGGQLSPSCEACSARRIAAAESYAVLQHPRQKASGMSPERFGEMSDRIMARIRGSSDG